MKTTVINTSNIAEFIQVCSVYEDGYEFIGCKYEKTARGHKNTATYRDARGREVKIKVEV